MVATRSAALIALLCLLAYASGEPEPSPSYDCCTCQPCYCNRPCCCCSTTTCGALVVPTLATVHSKGRSKCNDACCCCCKPCCQSCC